MKINNKLFLGLLIVIIIFGAVLIVLSTNFLNESIVVESEAKDLEVTVYNQNLGVVKECRSVFLYKGLNEVLYKDVASRIDPTSVMLKSTNSSINVLEQNYQYDLINTEKILQKYVDKNITAYRIYGDKKEKVEGTLLSFSGDELILQDTDGRIQTLSSDNLMLPEIPEGLITKPTLQWLISAGETKNNTLELSYMTSGMNWKANYVIVINANDTNLDLNGWVTVTNNAGTTFKDASLKLVAGDVNRVTAQDFAYDYLEEKSYAPRAASAPQFAEEALFEYHIYDLQRKTTLKNNEQKQISLLEAANVVVEKEYVYDDIKNWWWYGSKYQSTGDKKIAVMLNFKNSKENNIGIPLPSGVMRVFKEDSEEKLQFVGEDSIDHTPKDETLRILMGQAFDLMGERKQRDFNILDNWYEYEWAVNLRNHKDEDIIVTVIERTGGDWEIIEENYKSSKESNNEIKWRIPVKSNGESTLKYKIRYKRG